MGMNKWIKRILFHKQPKKNTNAYDPADYEDTSMKQGVDYNFTALTSVFKMEDFHYRKIGDYMCCYISSIVSVDKISEQIIRPLSHFSNKKDTRRLPVADVISGIETETVYEFNECVSKVLMGWSVILIPGEYPLAVNTFHAPERSVSPSENETTIFGPQESFNESIMTNMGILRKRLKTSNLHMKLVAVGMRTSTMVGVIWMEGIANPDNVDEMWNRLKRVEFDGMTDLSGIAEFIEDNPLSPFPNFLTTTQPQKAVSELLQGKIVVIADGSPNIFIAPSSFWEFFQSPDDYYNRWIAGSLLRAMRMFGLLASLFFTSIYVAITTFHYEMIPTAMIVSLLETREKVPFPPLYEALIMEFTIEFLREAGARLPTKIGQTIGIVGGIVIGQAAVQAGFTSNFLIISVAFSAISSFVIPSYLLANALRTIRYPIIIIAGIWGLFGIVIAYIVIALHLLEIRSLKAPYLSPLIPIRISDWKDMMLRFPTTFFMSRPTLSRSQDNVRGTKGNVTKPQEGEKKNE